MSKEKCPECGMPLDEKGNCTLCGYKKDTEKDSTSKVFDKAEKDANTKYCKHCGNIIDKDCVVCPRCGKQVEELKSDDRNIYINNSASSSASAASSTVIPTPVYRGKECNKWTSFVLCLLLGFLGGHKFYEGKIGMGILYIFTMGLFGIGWLIDLITILTKTNPYYV